MRIRMRMRMGDVDGDGSYYTYVGTYAYAYVPMQCVMLSRLYGFVGRQYCTYSYRRERGGNTTTTNNIQ